MKPEETYAKRRTSGRCSACGQVVWTGDIHADCPERQRCRDLEARFVMDGTYSEAGIRIARIAAMQREAASEGSQS
jgi:hypothetical protein